jgi:hypothetical protein
MTWLRISLASIAFYAACLGAAASKDLGGCKEPEAGSDKAPLFSPPLSNIVVGTGRLQFYSAPESHCAMAGVFVIPKDELVSYAETDDGWASVMYLNPKTGNSVTGWVRAARLKTTGSVGPNQ